MQKARRYLSGAVHLMKKGRTVVEMQVTRKGRQLSLVLVFVFTRSIVCFAPRKTPAASTRRQTRRSAFSLNTAFEWLAVERAMDQPYGNFSWFAASDRPISGGDETETMPLYPLGATYLPSLANHSLNNVEPRNIKMAQDLQEGGRFCVVLVALDTGRLASVGTVMRIVELEPQEQVGVVRRITVRCCAEELVDICGICNPEIASPESRLRRSRDYLKAYVRTRIMEPPAMECQYVATTIVNDYEAVRSAYLHGNGARNLPPFALQHLVEALPPWKEEEIMTEVGFWKAAQVWQTLCYTIREGRQITLSADRNELMVAAASAKGGPLKLPIHAEDLSPADRFQLIEMERQAQTDFVQLGLDPCLDFQVLLGMTRFDDRLEFLSRIIARERKRLESITPDLVDQKDKGDEEKRKGAWFEGFE
jgi:hypothetical protein